MGFENLCRPPDDDSRLLLSFIVWPARRSPKTKSRAIVTVRNRRGRPAAPTTARREDRSARVTSSSRCHCSSLQLQQRPSRSVPSSSLASRAHADFYTPRHQHTHAYMRIRWHGRPRECLSVRRVYAFTGR